MKKCVSSSYSYGARVKTWASEPPSNTRSMVSESCWLATAVSASGPNWRSVRNPNSRCPPRMSVAGVWRKTLPASIRWMMSSS